MTTTILLDNIAYIVGYTAGDYLLLMMSGIGLVMIFVSIFSRLTKE